MLHCTSSSSAGILWLKRSDDGNAVERIIATTRISITTTGVPDNVVNTKRLSVSWSTLRIRDVTEYDSGEYVCAAESDINTLDLLYAVNFSVNVNGKN